EDRVRAAAANPEAVARRLRAGERRRDPRGAGADDRDDAQPRRGGWRGAAGGRPADARPAGRQARRVDRKRRQREPRAAPCRAHVVTVFVTGGGRGFVAGHVVRALERAGHEVRHGWVDVRDADGLERAVLGCDAVMHAAALYSYTSSAAELEAINVNGT